MVSFWAVVATEAEVDVPGAGVAGAAGGGADEGGLDGAGAASVSPLPPQAAVIRAALAVRKDRRFINGCIVSR